MPSERRELSEIITRYQVEPKLSGDIYVEGPYDKRLLKWVAKQAALPELVVYEIDTVDISSLVLEKHGLYQSSNRNRVIALAHELAASVATIEKQAAFVIDRDLDDFLESPHHLPSLFCTDFTSSEMYLFEEPIMRKFLSFAARVPDLAVSDFMENVASELTNVFLVRIANASLNANIQSVGVDRSCAMAADGRFQLDIDDYLSRRLMSSGQIARLEEFKSEMARFAEKLPPDSRSRMHGHDLIHVLSWYLQKSPGKGVLGTTRALETALLMGLDAERLLKQRHFAALLAWARTSATYSGNIHTGDG